MPRFVDPDDIGERMIVSGIGHHGTMSSADRDESLRPELCDRTLRRSERHPETLAEIGEGRKPVTRREHATCDCPAEIGGDPPIGATVADNRGRRGQLACGIQCRRQGGHAARQTSCRALISLRDPGAVDAQGGRTAATVSEPSRNRTDVDARSNELGGRVVPELVNVLRTTYGTTPNV